VVGAGTSKPLTSVVSLAKLDPKKLPGLKNSSTIEPLYGPVGTGIWNEPLEVPSKVPSLLMSVKNALDSKPSKKIAPKIRRNWPSMSAISVSPFASTIVT
jgi:hypothetical protein